jgi:aminoglycoside phosphotransferase (APT) family kinase protein
LTHNVTRRLERLEARAKEVAAAFPEPHTICFVEPVNKRVTSTLTWENGKSVWTHFGPPRERAEFEPMV